jgi:UDP-2,3-diacylglucosamine hydrolase
VLAVSVYFVSDLHLEDDKPHLTEIFVRFLRGRARSARAVYLLGDIFEVWIGDDDPAPLVTRIAAEIRAVADSGVDVFFMHGNRDFLLRKAYADRAGMQLLEDPITVTLGGIPTVLAHGDRYCTDDTAYQAFRQKARSPEWQAKVLGWPLWRRRLTARLARYLSKRRYQKKVRQTGNANQIGDVAQEAIIQAFRDHAVPRMIHGHTHRPAEHDVDLGNGRGQRIVLSDWRETGEALEVRDDGTFVRHTLL